MEIRAVQGESVAVAAPDGQCVYMVVQNIHRHRTAEGGHAVFEPPGPLHFGNRQHLEGEVWVGKQVSRLVVERRHG